MNEIIMRKEYISPQKKVQWCCGIDFLEFNENGNFHTYFWTDNPEQQNEEELKRFSLALTEFVKNYR